MRRDNLGNGWDRLCRTRIVFSDSLKRGRFFVEIAVHKGMVRIAALAWAVENIDLVALFEAERGLAASAVGSADPIGALAIAAVDQDHGKG